MAADISATIGLDGSGFHSAINNMAAASKRFARSLESQFAQLQGGQAGLDRYRASLLNMSTSQRQVVENLIKRNETERQRQAADKLAQAQAAQRQAAINGTISALQREAAAIGKTAEQLQLLELRSQGASIAQLAQARAAQKSLAAARAQQENRQAIDGIIGALQREHDALGKTAAQLQLLELRSKGATQAQIAQAQALQQATAKHQSEQKRKQAVDGLVASINREAAAIGKTNAELKIMELRSNGATQAQIRQARQTLALTEAHNRLQAAQSRSSPLGSAAGAAAAVGGTAGIIQMADAWTTLQNRLKLVHGTQAQVAAAQQGIIGIARETGQSLGSVGDVYSKLAQNQKALNLNNLELVQITEITTKAVANGGATAEGAAAGLMQFGQALSFGKLQGDELNSIMENKPGLAQALAAGLSVSVGQLRSLAQNGELSSQKLVQALQKAGDGVRADFAKTDFTIAQSFTVLQNKLTEFVGQTGESSGAVKAFAGTLRFLGDNIDSVATVVGGLAALSLTRWAITSAAGLVQMTAAMVATSGAAGTATAAQTALSVAVSRTGTASALASFQVRGFAGSLAVLRVGAVATAGALWALPAAAVQGGFTLLAKGAAVAGGALTAMSARISAAGTVGKLGAIGTAAAAAGTGLYSLYKFAKGEDASNWISDSVDKLFGLDTQVESLGTKLYDWLNPVEKFNEKLDEAAVKAHAVSGWQSISGAIAAQGGFAEYSAGKQSDAGLSKAISDTVLKYQEQAAAIGKTKEQMDLLTLAAQKEELLKKKKIEFEEKFKHENADNRAKLVQQSLANTAAALDADIKSVSAAMKQAETAAKAKAEADKAAEIAAKNRRVVDESIASFEQQVAELGKSTEEITQMRLAAAGATQGELAKTRAMQDVIRQYERQAGVMKTLDNLRGQLERVGKSAAEIKLLDLKNAGATAEQLSQASALLQAIAAKEQAHQTISTAGDKMLGAANMMRQAADKSVSSVDERYAALQAKVAQDRAETAAREAEIRQREKAKAATQGGFTDLQWQLWSRQTYGHDWYERTAEYKAAVAASKQHAEAATAAAASLQQAGGSLGNAAHNLQNAADKLFQQATSSLPAPAAVQNGVQGAPNMGQITLDLRFPNGKALTGILFGNQEFLKKLKEQTKTNVESWLLGVRDAVR